MTDNLSIDLEIVKTKLATLAENTKVTALAKVHPPEQTITIGVEVAENLVLMAESFLRMEKALVKVRDANRELDRHVRP